ncbi:MAG: redoxin domain-containing protein [Planctomycetes bacterium]|nr:redoxin domain-containing protein [Planctomycetota bacterium]
MPARASLLTSVLVAASLLSAGCFGPRVVHDEWRPGVPKRHGETVLGKQQGQWRYWYDTGAKQAEGAWHKDYQDGPWTWWYADGRVRQTGAYAGQGLDPKKLSSSPRTGHWRFWYDNGQLQCEGDYAEDRQVGQWRFFTKDGKPHAVGSFTKGVKDGAWTWWHANGKRKESGAFASGLKVGEWTTYNDAGEIASLTSYTVDGKVVEAKPMVLIAPTPPPPVPAPSEAGVAAEPPPLVAQTPVAAAPVDAAPAKPAHVETTAKPAEPELTLPAQDAPPLSPTISAPALWTASQEGVAANLVRMYERGEVKIRGYEEDITGTPATRQKRDLLGKPLSQTRYLSATGSVLDLAKHKGKKPVLMVILRGFSGQVCLYCAAQTTAISKNIQKFNDLGVEVVVVYPGPVEAVAPFIEAVRSLAKEPPPMPVVLDVSLIAVRKLGIEDNLAKASSLIIDKEGIVRYAYVGKTIADRPAVNDLLNELSQYVK